MENKQYKRNLCLIGAGYWGKNLVRNFHELGALAMVCDPSEACRAAVTEIAPGVATSTDFNDTLKASEIDAVAIATPANTHFNLAATALIAGKDVFVEKPLTLKLSDGEELKRLAEEHGRILMVGHLLEYHPAVLKLRELLKSGDLGSLNYIYSNRLSFGKIRTEENSLWSFAPHDIAVILRLVGELPLKVISVGGSYITPYVDDVTVSCLHFGSGLRAHVFVSWLNPFKEQKLVVIGDKQMAVFDDRLQDEKLLLYNQRVDINNRQPLLQKGDTSVIQLPSDEPLRKECEHFLDCIRTREAPLTSAASGNDVLRVLQACQLSLQSEGRPTLLSDID